MTKEPKIAREALQAVRYFEQHGRVVGGVTFKGREFSLIFTNDDTTQIPEVDTVAMS